MKKDKPMFYKKEINYTRWGIILLCVALLVFYVIG